MRYTVLNIKNFTEILKGVSNASSDKGYQIWISSKVKNGEVSCGVSAIKDGVIQGTAVFKVRLIMVDVDENGNEAPVENPSGWARKISLPTYFAEAVYALGEESESVFLTVYENEVKVSNRTAEIRIPLISDFELSKGPADLEQRRFRIDRKTLLNKLRKIQAGSHPSAEDTISFRVSTEGTMEIISVCNYLIPKDVVTVEMVADQEKGAGRISMCSISAKKLISLCSVEAEKMEFIAYVDENEVAKQLSIHLDKTFTFLFNTKKNPPESAFSFPEIAANAYYYRMKINAGDLNKALSILSIGIPANKRNDTVVHLCPQKEEKVIYVSDEEQRHLAYIPYDELEGEIEEGVSDIYSKLNVVANAIAPFDDIVTLSKSENMLYMEEDTFMCVSTFHVSTSTKRTVEDTEVSDDENEE